MEKERSKSRRRRPQTAHYPIKREFDSKYSSLKKSKKKKISKKKENEYMHIIKEYEDVLKDKVKEKKFKKKKAKKEPYTLASREQNLSKGSHDPYEKYISFYPSKTSESEMFDSKFRKS